MSIDEIIKDLVIERDAEKIEYTTQESIADHKKKCDFLIDFLESCRWVPCNERLPEVRKDCLVTVKYTGFMGMHGTWVKTGHIENDGNWWGGCAGGEVIAWKPLPDGYKEN